LEKTNLLTIEFTVNGQRIYFEEKNKVVADSRQYLYAVFNFSSEWKNPIFALFSTDANTNKSIGVQLDENNGCYVPFEVIKAPGFYVSVYCVDGEKFITADKRKVNVSQSGYSSDGVTWLPLGNGTSGPDESEEHGGKSILDEILSEAESVNRYLYTAATVGDFDTAYQAAQSAITGSTSTQQQALADLRAAIDGLLGATFAFISGNIVMTKNKDYPIAQYVVYDGIGTPIAIMSENESYVIITNNGQILRSIGVGISYIRFAVEEVKALTGADYLRKYANVTS